MSKQFKPFYVHVNFNKPGPLEGRVFRAATLLVSPDENEQMCKVQVAVCSKKDEFVKRMGRDYAAKAPAQLTNKRALPGLVADVANSCDKFKRFAGYDFNYLLRNFL